MANETLEVIQSPSLTQRGLALDLNARLSPFFKVLILNRANFFITHQKLHSRSCIKLTKAVDGCEV